ncbi:MAG: hypothetical protein JF628_05130 [Sphingomonas sp.]|nr:hypothetical protein [Sphingomonas sp.]
MSGYQSVLYSFGLATSDLALLGGGVALVVAVLFLGLSGNKRGRGWLAGLGWLALILSVGALGYGTLHGAASANQAPA